MERDVVEVVAWSPQWAARFRRAKAELQQALPADATIEHIGSTSIPGLSAKPIIDILATTSHVVALRSDPSALERLGYRYDPKYFQDDLDHLFLRRDTGGRRTEHLHIFHPRSPKPASNRIFRDYLIADEDAAHRYAVAKQIAAREHPGSRAAYGRAKEQVLQQLLAEAQLWRQTRAFPAPIVLREEHS